MSTDPTQVIETTAATEAALDIESIKEIMFVEVHPSRRKYPLSFRHCGELHQYHLWQTLEHQQD